MNMTKRHIELFTLQQAINNFFIDRGFLHTLTPPAVENPGMEIHIHPFKLYSVNEKKEKDLYLHTSPEFHMKGLLSLGYEKIYSLSYCFRDEPDSSTHRCQFLMLEWYRANEHYEQIMKDTLDLIDHCHHYLKDNSIRVQNFTPIKKITVAEIFSEILNIEIFVYSKKYDLFNLIKNNFPEIHIGKIDEYSWDDLYFLLFLNKIENRLSDFGNILLYEFPAQLAALSTIKENNTKVCERFEIYINGIEICNCFNELTNLKTQRDRFQKQAKEKKELYHYELPEPSSFYQSLETGLPKSAGIALGVERLLMSLTRIDNPFFD